MENNFSQKKSAFSGEQPTILNFLQTLLTHSPPYCKIQLLKTKHKAFKILHLNYKRLTRNCQSNFKEVFFIWKIKF